MKTYSACQHHHENQLYDSLVEPPSNLVYAGFVAAAQYDGLAFCATWRWLVGCHVVGNIRLRRRRCPLVCRKTPLISFQQSQ